MQISLHLILLGWTSACSGSTLCRRRDAGWWAAGALLGLVPLQAGMPPLADQAQGAMLQCILALFMLLRIITPQAVLFGAGICGTQLAASTLPLAVSFLPALFALAAMTLAIGRPGFRDRRLLDESLLAVLLLGFALAALPELGSGWRAAATLQGETGAAGSLGELPWPLALSICACVAGALSVLIVYNKLK